MIQKYMASQVPLVVIAYERRDSTYVLVGVLSADSDGKGEWEKLSGPISLEQLAHGTGPDRYMYGRPEVREGVSYAFFPHFDHIFDDISSVISSVLASAQVQARPIPELAFALAKATSQVTVNVTIKFNGAKRHANWIRIDDQEIVELASPILLNEAGVSAACRAYDWRSEGPYYQGKHAYNIVFYPGEQNGLTVSAKTDVQERTEKYQRLNTWAQAAIRNKAAEQEFLEYVK